MDLTFREAHIEDLPAIVRMLADDFLGQQRDRAEEPLPEVYQSAFREIEADPNNELIVAVLSLPPKSSSGVEISFARSSLETTDSGLARSPQAVVGTLQLTFTPSISFRGGKRCTVESVRVDAAYRGKGIGREMMLWAITRAKEAGCVSMQLTTNNERTDAHRFYKDLGFSATHTGMKLGLK